MIEKHPGRKGPFSLALVAEAAFDPLVRGLDRAEKIRRMHAITIADYPAGRPLTDKDFERIGRPAGDAADASGPTVEDAADHPPSPGLTSPAASPSGCRVIYRRNCRCPRR